MKNCFGRNEQIITKSIYSSRMQPEFNLIFRRSFGPFLVTFGTHFPSFWRSFWSFLELWGGPGDNSFVEFRFDFPDSILARFGLHFETIFETFFDTCSMRISVCIFYLIFNDLGSHFGSVLGDFLIDFGSKRSFWVKNAFFIKTL